MGRRFSVGGISVKLRGSGSCKTPSSYEMLSPKNASLRRPTAEMSGGKMPPHSKSALVNDPPLRRTAGISEKKIPPRVAGTNTVDIFLS